MELKQPRKVITIGMRDECILHLSRPLQQRASDTIATVEQEPVWFDVDPSGEKGGGKSGYRYRLRHGT